MKWTRSYNTHNAKSGGYEAEVVENYACGAAKIPPAERYLLELRAMDEEEAGL